jgi:peptide/nickel transport system ATP-binding protein/oligopeptide transport system ATP-binding protein
MYLGEIVEIAETDDLFRNFRHPYTESLFNAIPEPNPDFANKRTALSGEVPSPINPPEGCSFHPRCPRATNKCAIFDPELERIDGAPAGHRGACIRMDKFEPDNPLKSKAGEKIVNNYSQNQFKKNDYI